MSMEEDDKARAQHQGVGSTDNRKQELDDCKIAEGCKYMIALKK